MLPKAILAVATLSLPLLACDPPPCSEPLPRGDGEVSAPCATVAECREGLVCVGESFLEDAHCAEPSALPGGEDPGCLAHASDWTLHEADGVRPITTDDEGCELLVFESACNCTGSLGDGGCLPTFPLHRQETWRSCNRCCWRLVAFWRDEEACSGD